MSPLSVQTDPWQASVPRASGDEPDLAQAHAMERGCSPRERG